MPLHERTCFVETATHTHHEDDVDTLPIREVYRRLDRTTGIEPRSNPPRESSAVEGSRMDKAAVSAEKFVPITCDGPVLFVHVEERNAVGEVGVVWVPGKEGPREGINLGRYVHCCGLP